MYVTVTEEKCLHLPVSVRQESLISRSVSVVFGTILLNALQRQLSKQQTPTPSECLIVIQECARPDLSHVIAVTGKVLNC